jgi:hypothetical protein
MMKNLFGLLSLILLFTACGMSPNLKESTATVADSSSLKEIVEEQDSSYRLEGSKLYATDGKSNAVYTMDEDGRVLARIGNNPVYECYCDGFPVGEGCYITAEGRDGLHCCCSDRCNNDVPPGGGKSFCKWKKVKLETVSQGALLQLKIQSALMDSIPPNEPFNKAGYRSIRPGELEFEKEDLFELREKDGKTIVYLKEVNKAVTCECECDHGDCIVRGSGSRIYCMSKANANCAMVPNGNPCNGCAWKWVKGISNTSDK